MSSIFDRTLEHYFARLGTCVAVRPFYFIAIPVVLSFVLGFNLRLREQLNEHNIEWLYTPLNARSVYEKNTLSEHWPINPTRFIAGRSFDLKRTAQVIVRLKQGGNILTNDVLRVIDSFNSWVIEGGVVGQGIGGLKNYSFTDLCLRWEDKCSWTNKHIFVLNYMIEHLGDKSYFGDMSYPRIQVVQGSTPMYAGNLLGGVHLDPATIKGSTGVMEAAEALYLIYYLRSDNSEFKEGARQWEKQFSDILERASADPEVILDFAYMHSSSLFQGIEENASQMTPKFIITQNILITFAILCCFRLRKASKNSKWRMIIDWDRSKPFLGFCGIATSGMGIVAGMGVSLLCNTKFNAIVCVMPFLIMAIGLDDMFIIVCSWQQSKCHAHAVAGRMAHTMAHSAVSITVTSLTSFTSFMIGMISELPAVKMFCQYTALALAFNYIFQITFFAGCLALSGEFEQGNRFYWMKLNDSDSTSLDSDSQITLPLGTPVAFAISQNSRTVENLHEMDGPDGKTEKMSFISRIVVPTMLNPISKFVIVVIFCAYIAVSVYGCFQIVEGLDQEKLVLKNHHVVKFYRFLNRYFWGIGQQVEIIVNNAPNLTLSENRRYLHNFVRQMENSRFTMNSDATDFFLREYDKLLNRTKTTVKDVDSLWTDSLYHWSMSNAFSRSIFPDLSFRNATDLEHETCKCKKILKAFRFRVGLKNFNSTINQRDAATEIRQMAAQHPDLNVTTYHQEWPFMDQYSMILENTIVSIVIALACMAVISVMFFRNVLCVISVVLTIVSIDVGVIGLMSLWHVNLDCVSLVTIIMSIGLSVDYAAHVAYSYVSAGSNEFPSDSQITDKITPEQKICRALESIGVPVLQGAASTLLGVSVLQLIDAYMVQVFFKCTFLVILLGIVHACVFLPVMLSICESLISKTRIKWTNMQDYCSKKEVDRSSL